MRYTIGSNANEEILVGDLVLTVINLVVGEYTVLEVDKERRRIRVKGERWIYPESRILLLNKKRTV